ncbi:sirohydrochlorin cobaltochelatase [Corynebacterium capitovis DSM 44611]|uniref:sirohydrochlorin chelatase n=1 Tax=Corynebacterium capitovis TaxID=131081 RepID=UPI00035D02CF|nr:sirohydrochlorin chelatase [Corynebacterium capitovis]WKD58246.1 sirohydrochlorin cobaltochelatase [Corynebacterium capitovis DSM 44611]
MAARTAVLITLSHGSRHSAASDGVQRLTEAAGGVLGVPAVAAHLEFTTPDLTGAAATAARAGHTRAVVVPLLFTKAFHATTDVPAAVAAARENTGVELILADGIGQGDDVVKLLAAKLRSDAPDGAHVVLYPVGTSNARAAGATTEFGARLAAASGRGVTVVPATGRGEATGNDGLASVAASYPRVHVLPLFVTDGLLLDRARRAVAGIQDATGARITQSAPLTTGLAGIIAARYRGALHENTRSQ